MSKLIKMRKYYDITVEVGIDRNPDEVHEYFNKEVKMNMPMVSDITLDEAIVNSTEESDWKIEETALKPETGEIYSLDEFNPTELFADCNPEKILIVLYDSAGKRSNHIEALVNLKIWLSDYTHWSWSPNLPK